MLDNLEAVLQEGESGGTIAPAMRNMGMCCGGWAKRRTRVACC